MSGADGYLLETCGLEKRFGGVVAAQDLNFRLRAGERRCIIGPNGAGKTTLFNLVTGGLRPDAGRILFNGREITKESVSKIARAGIARTFQIPNFFTNLSVWENVRLGVQRHRESFNPLASSARLREQEEETLRILGVVELTDRAGVAAGTLSHGGQKRLELALALTQRPRLLLLDEPTAGMGIQETREMTILVRRLAVETTILVIEHDMDFVRQISERITVFHRGTILAEGTPAEIEAHPEVRDIYLGAEV